MSSYWFIPLVVESILLLFLIAYDNGVWATVSVVATLLVVHFTGMVNILEYVSRNAGTVLALAAAYAVVGVVWSIVKWTLFVYNKKAAYTEHRAEFCKKHGISGTSIPAQLKEEFQRGLGFGYDTSPPKIIKHKNDMMRWTFYWPFSMINSLIRDFARKLFNLVFDTMKNALQSISNKAWSEFDQDFK